MTQYENDILSMPHLSTDDILRTAQKHVPQSFRNIPWTHPELDHGKGILASEDALNCYLAAYGKMHANKMFLILRNCRLDNLEDKFEVVDWGCGQGLASLCLVEHLQKQGKPLPFRITLVDASPAALRRAELHLNAMTRGAAELQCVTKLLPSSPSNCFCGPQVQTSQPFVLHLLSNIFDLPGLSLSALARVITRTGRKNIVLCAAHYKMAEKIEEFSKYAGASRDRTLFAAAQKYLWMSPNGHPYGAALKAFRTSWYSEAEEAVRMSESLPLAA